jgi:hypothetical protein
VARLRAECVRTGVREVNVSRGIARLMPLALKTSQRIRLQRLLRDAVYKEDLAQLVVPIKSGADAAEGLATLLGVLVPAPAEGGVGSGAGAAAGAAATGTADKQPVASSTP